MTTSPASRTSLVLALLLSGAGCATTDPAANPQRRDLDAIKAEQASLTPAQVLESLRRGKVERIRELSPILRDLESAGQIRIVGSVYDLLTGRVRFLSQGGLP